MLVYVVAVVVGIVVTIVLKTGPDRPVQLVQLETENCPVITKNQKVNKNWK